VRSRSTEVVLINVYDVADRSFALPATRGGKDLLNTAPLAALRSVLPLRFELRLSLFKLGLLLSS
jgi:hypothetical protein